MKPFVDPLETKEAKAMLDELQAGRFGFRDLWLLIRHPKLVCISSAFGLWVMARLFIIDSLNVKK